MVGATHGPEAGGGPRPEAAVSQIHGPWWGPPNTGPELGELRTSSRAVRDARRAAAVIRLSPFLSPATSPTSASPDASGRKAEVTSAPLSRTSTSESATRRETPTRTRTSPPET